MFVSRLRQLVESNVPHAANDAAVANAMAQGPEDHELGVARVVLAQALQVTGGSCDGSARRKSQTLEGLCVLREMTAGKPGHEARTFDLINDFTDQLGETHVRARVRNSGVPVFGEDVIAHVGANGRVRDVTNFEATAGLELDVTPKLTPLQALDTARRALAAEPRTSSEPTLVIARDTAGEFRLAWHVIFTTEHRAVPTRTHYFVDAKDNGIVLTFDENQGVIPRSWR